MNKVLALLVLLIVAVSCKTTKQIPGVPTIKKNKDLVEKINESQITSEYIRIKATGKFQQGDESQSFRADIRIKKDSVIWIELSDPLIGIKAARAFITHDSVAFINKIQNEYFTGSFDYLNEMLKTRVDFELLQNLLLGEPLRSINLDESIDLQLMPHHYALYYYPKEDPLFQFTNPNFYFEIEPDHFDIKRQEASDGGQKVKAQYSDFKIVEKQSIPTKVEVNLFFENAIRLQLEYTDIKLGDKISFPFKISSKYKRVQ